jgi:hypothetical protein
MAAGVDTTFPRDDSTALELLREYSDKAGKLAAQGGPGHSAARKNLPRTGSSLLLHSVSLAVSSRITVAVQRETNCQFDPTFPEV